MTTPSPGSITFLPWARQGLAGGAAVNGNAASRAGRLELPVKLRLNTAEVAMALRFYGPADVVGLEPSQIVRTFPADGATGIQPNLFPLVEFDRPDFPWLFSPVGPAEPERWQPWLTLVVVPKAVVDWQRGTASRLTCPVEELPPISEAWAWAHAQVVQGEAASDGTLPTAEALLRSGSRSLSRLIAARRLASRTGYVACLVPTYAVGSKAGLSQTVTPDDLAALAPAWSAGSAGSVTLPVLHGWEFTTGEDDDFESLARAIRHKPPPDELGLLTIDARRPGWGFEPVAEGDAAADLPMQGALRPLNAPSARWPDDVARAYGARLRAALESQAARTAAGPVPLVKPPIYGQSYPRAAALPAQGDPPAWLGEVNLSPAHRIAAGLGTQVVRFEQESLVAAAWVQLASWQRENEERRRRQLTEEVSDTIVKRRPTDGRMAATPIGRALPRLGPRWRTRALAAGNPGGAPAPIAATLGAVSAAFGAATVRPAAPTAAAPGPPPDPSSPTELATFSPRFEAPACELLRDYFPEYLLPGMGGLSPDSIMLLESNPGFVEAFLVGLNHELGREFLWRGLPADPRGTPFRIFWRRHGGRGGDADIEPIADWPSDSSLGSHAPSGAATEPLVLLFRSEIFRRHPRASLVARRAQWNGNRRALGDDELAPLFRITRAPDLTLVGFDLEAKDALGADTPAGDAGWYFLLQEQVSEARFGLDATRSYGGLPGQWSNLSWGHLAASAEELERIRWLSPAAKPNTTLPVDAAGPNATFGANSAHMAFVCRRLPFGLAVHARAWL